MSNQLKAALTAFLRLRLKEGVVDNIEDDVNLKWLDDQIRNMTPGALDVTIERSRQIEKGHDQTHDDKHKDGDLTIKAVALLMRTKPGTASIESLTKSAALIIAEIDRLKRIQLAEELTLAS